MLTVVVIVCIIRFWYTYCTIRNSVVGPAYFFLPILFICLPFAYHFSVEFLQPDDPEEMARITAWGGFVCPPAEAGLSARVYLDPGFTMIGLAMARSIGEYFLSI